MRFIIPPGGRSWRGAELRKFECGGTRWHQITALHDGRGYLVWVTRPFEESVLASFAFTE